MIENPVLPTITEAIILAGGLGTRLRDTVPNLPKCMAPVAGRPFLFYVINYLRSQGVTRFILSLGYKHQVIETYLGKEFSRLNYSVVVENQPLGTGGAILLALSKATTDNIIITNGDTLFKADLSSLTASHLTKNAACSLALKPMKDFDRYGVVETDDEHRITTFQEKKFYAHGLINGGLYILNRDAFSKHSFPHVFSFEKDYLEKNFATDKLIGIKDDAYFIDIGIPEDYSKAEVDLQRKELDLTSIDKNWTLLLDRDGVINIDKEGSYIFSVDEFVFMEGAPAFFKKLTERFRHIIIVTNQRGVGRGLMTEDALTLVNEKMSTGISEAGGKLDAIYYAIKNDDLDPDRKPNPGMAFRAKREFPDIDLEKTIMIGNNFSDMLFGRNAGIYTIFLRTTIRNVRLPHPDIDAIFETLADFANAL